MMISNQVSVLALLVVLAVSGSYALPASTRVDDDAVPAELETVADTSDLADVALARTRKDISSANCVDFLYVMAHTSGIASAGADAGHDVEMRVSGQTRSVRLPNLPGDDYLEHKGDLWKLNLRDHFGFGGCVRKGDIEYIALEEHSNDGWNIDSIITILRDDHAYGRDYQVATMDMDIFRWIDGDSHSDRRRFELTRIY